MSSVQSSGGGAVLEREPLVTGGKTLADINEDVTRPLETFPDKRWYMAMAVALTCLVGGFSCMGYFIYEGMGLGGIQSPVGWGVFIINFVFWIGIGHAGTLISAILFLFRQKWRTSINRSAEAMTIFAVMTAGIFPLLHTGRPWVAFWLFPYPNERGPLWVNFRSPLLWDVFAVSTYLTISAVFWYVGLVPDLASIRDRAKNKIRKAVYGAMAMGWKGANRDWSHYEVTYLILAGLSTPLVLSVHTIVSFDFAVSLMPGWHTTIFPPYFVAGAVFSGFAMVVTLMVLMRELFNLQDYVTVNHLENMNKIILLTGSLVGYAYASEFFIAWYSGNPYERFIFIQRALGPMAWSYWTMIACNVFWPQLFWFRKIRRNIKAMLIITVLVNIGMWFERFVIVVTSLNQDFLPASWRLFHPSLWDYGVTIGSFGLFFTLFLGFCRLLPVLAMSEIKGVHNVGRSSPGGH